MTESEHNHEEQALRALLASVDKDVPSPDPEFRRRLHAESLAAFAASTSAGPAEGEADENEQIKPQRGNWRTRMFRIAWRGAAAVAAAGIVVVIALLARTSQAADGPTLAEALDKLGESKTVHLRIAQSGKTSEAWYSQPGRLRRNDPDGTYLIARGDTAWDVNEKANLAASRPADYISGGDGNVRLDALALLDLGESKDLSVALGKPAAERAKRDGVECLIYRTDITLPRGPARLEAVVDPATRLLRSLEITVDRDGKVTPVAKLTVLDVDKPVREDLFVVGETLTEDGRIGKIVDAQGIVLVKPVMASRWTPVRSGLILKPGDWVQTDVRGANAATVRLAGQGELVIGPGSLVELPTPRQVRLTYGEVKVAPPAKAVIELVGPGKQQAEAAGRGVYRVQDANLVRLAKDPTWLKSFEGREVNDSIGSLVAKIDGRNVPLTVGYHKVTVDIRDQIARTVVEESFVNRTNGRLEGVFYFPLPQDASISGFGMWIGGELVEADIVEKQRAREIYEEILRERRDPGLLEWSGGNLFKARVFPIEAHSEKRIKITYTQVLPMRAGGYRYSYSLQSEMLKLHPLRELALDVKVNSALPLKSVSCPTHMARIDKTAHSAHVEFTAQEYAPKSDFEVVIQTDAGRPDVVLVPHRRGEDGYFMLMLSAPGENGAWQREILPDAAADGPRELLILADTSGSMDSQQRQQQEEFIVALLSSLRPTDTFNLAACDVECDWVFEKSGLADANRISAARDFLARRQSLGWTDLDKAFASVLGRCGERTNVVYVGDGITTTGDADPAAFGRRLKRMHEGKTGTFHAVSVGSLYESGVLKAIASLDGGSVRQITAQHGPSAAALELLGEMSRPPLRDLKVEFRGVRTARVYPQELPNLPAGCQQILLGRYLPEGVDQSGEVVVTAARAGQPVRYSARVDLKDAEHGNSFIPRLWARMHLDVLLDQGASQAIQDEIIALSEEYHIMTPYTSLLVLESDADRERFKVKRRFQMRDGEKFFAEGRDNANYELTQQQMLRAGNWRLGLRRGVLQQFSTLGRDIQVFQQPSQFAQGRLGMWNGQYKYAQDGGWGGGGMFGDEVEYRLNVPTEGADTYGLWDDGRRGGFGVGDDLWHGDIDRLSDMKLGAMDYETSDLQTLSSWLDSAEEEVASGLEMPYASATPSPVLFAPGRSRSKDFSEGGSIFGPAGASEPASAFPDISYSKRLRHEGYWRDRQYTQWLDTLFPPLSPPPSDPPALEQRWPAEARAVSDSLLRTGVLAAIEGGLVADRQVDSFDVQTGDLTARARTLTLVGPKSWLIRTEYDNQQTTIQWCDGERRSVYNCGFLLGRTRSAKPEDLRNSPLDFGSYAFSSLERSYAASQVKQTAQGEDRVLLTLSNPDNPDWEVQVLVDSARHVVLRFEQFNDGNTVSHQEYSDFVQVAGAWWPGKVKTYDEKRRLCTVITIKLSALAPEGFGRQLQAQLADKPRVQFIVEPGRTLSEVKQAVALGKADFDDQLTMLLHFSRSQQWDRVMDHLAAAEKLAGDKPGMRWIRDVVLQISGRNAERKEMLMQAAAELAKAPKPSREDLALAQYILAQSASMMEGNERLALLDELKPVFDRQPAYLLGPKQWSLQRVSLLQQVGRQEEALALLKQLAEQFGRDYSLQLQYAQGLVNVGQLADAYAWLEGAMARDGWLDWQQEQLRGRYADMLYNEGRYADLLSWTEKWMALDLPGTNAYQRYLSSLIRIGRRDDAYKLIAQWLEQGRSPKRLPASVAQRLNAAISQALGQGYNMYSDRIDPRWLEPLADTAIALARHPSHSYLSEWIMNNWRFNRTGAGRRVRTAAVKMLLAEADTLTQSQIQRLVNWAMANDPAVEAGTWKEIAGGLHKRWLAETDEQKKNAIGQTLAWIYSARLDAADHLAFLREQRKDGPAKFRTQYTRQLFDALIAQPHDPNLEDEALGLIEKLSDSDDQAQRMASAVQALYSFVDRMLQARFNARIAALEHPEELSRTELRDKQAEFLRQAQIALADRLAAEEPNRQGAILPWLTIERVYLDVQADRNLPKAASVCWKILGDQPKALDPDEDPNAMFDEVLRNRAMMTLANLACRRNAAPALIDRLSRYIDKGIESDQDDPRWKLMKYALLVGLDRPKDLENALSVWTRRQDQDNRWKVALGYLLAEQGKLADAIKLFEAVAAADELGPAEYRALADWYMAVDRRDAYRRAMIDAYKVAEEWRLSNLLYHRLQPWQEYDGKVPSELDEQVLLIFAALFEKSSSPQNYLDILRQYYTATRDFRLLSGMADAVIGHTAGEIYPFLQSLGGVLSEVHDEATVDSIIEYLGKVRPQGKTDIDLRALDLLEALAERRAVELLNQPGPHGDKAVAAMERAFKRAWSRGEPRMMADLLASMGTIAYKPLAELQVRQAEVLYRDLPKGTEDRLHVALRLANLYWAYSRHDNAVDLLTDALDEFQTAHDGVLPQSANDALGTLVSYHEQRSRYALGEGVLLEQLKHPVHVRQQYWLTRRLCELYSNAVRDEGEVSLGKGQALYEAAAAKMIALLATPDQEYRYYFVQQLCELYKAAHRRHLDGVADDLRAFAFKTVPSLMERQTSYYQSIVSTVGETLRKLATPRDALAFYIERVEQEPAWFRWNHQDGWNHHSYRWGELRQKVGDENLGDLAPRLLKIVLAELKRDLQTQTQRSRTMYYRNHSYYWAAKEEDFLKAAEEVYAESKDSGSSVAYIAQYLFWGLGRHDRAIEILFIAHRAERLDEGAQWQLVEYLHQENRYGESIAVLQGMIERWPGSIRYRTALMRAFYHTKRPAELKGLLAQTDEYFHQDGRWSEGPMAELAAACLATELYAESVTYYKELIPLHQRTHARRGIGNGTLSDYYGGMARAYAGIGKTAEAVDAACGAIIAWGPGHGQRTHALNALRNVLQSAPDLDRYVAQLDKQAADGGLDNPIVRKALGQVYMNKSEYAKALKQLALACQLQPNDTEIHQALLACYDQQKDKQGAIGQLLQTLQLARRDINLYRDLGKRYADLDRGDQAERAYTSIVEALPNESESHALLAEIRQEQDRWPDAVEQWEQVARIRALEPTGLLKLAEAQVRLKRWDDLAKTIRRLRARSWPGRFGDVESKIRQLERRLDNHK